MHLRPQRLSSLRSRWFPSKRPERRAMTPRQTPEQKPKLLEPQPRTQIRRMSPKLSKWRPKLWGWPDGQELEVNTFLRWMLSARWSFGPVEPRMAPANRTRMENRG